MSLRERERCTNYGEREWRDLMVNMSGSKIEGVYGRVYFDPSWRENILHAAHHYTRYGINYSLGVMKKEISVSNIPLIMLLGQHMIQTVIRSVPRACSYC